MKETEICRSQLVRDPNVHSMKVLSSFIKSFYFITLLATVQPFLPPLGAAEIDGFWKFTDNSIQKIAEHLRASSSDDQDTEESIDSYRNHIREFQVSGSKEIKIRLIQFKNLGDRYPRFIREFDLKYNRTTDEAFSISDGDKDLFSGRVTGQTMYLDDVASGNKLELIKLDKGEVSYTDEKPHSPQKLDKSPKARKLTEPIFPQNLRSVGIAGSVELKFMVNTDGTTSEVQIISSPHPELSKAAIDAILTSTFIPGKIDGRSARSQVKIPITFR